MSKIVSMQIEAMYLKYRFICNKLMTGCINMINFLEEPVDASLKLYFSELQIGE